MRSLGLALLVAALLGAGVRAGETLSLEGGRLTMPAAVKGVLERAYPGFRPFSTSDYLPDIRSRYPFTARQAPFAVIADLNGDGREDLVVEGRDAKSQLLLAVLSMPGGLGVKTLEKGPRRDPASQTYEVGNGQTQRGLWVYLKRIPPGTLESGYEDEPLNLRHAAVERIYFMKAAVVLYYADGRFREYVTGD